MSALVGIIGAGGLVGRRLAQALAARTDASLRLGGRRPDAYADLAAACGERATSHAVDIDDAASLAAFVRGCTLVVNAAGPSTRIGARVAEAALHARVDYLDPGGYDPLLDAFERDASRIREHGLRFVANAGLLPGLSGALPAALARTLPRCERLDVAYVGTDRWSWASAYDIVVSLGDFGLERPFCAIRNGSAERRPWWRASRAYTLPAPIGKVRAWRLYTEELARLARDERIAQVNVYGVNHGPASARVLAATKLLRRYRTEAGRERAAHALVAASERDARTHPACFAIVVDAYGEDAATHRQATLVIDDTYAGTAEVVAIAAQAMLERRIAPGAYSLHEALAPEWLVDRFLASGVRARLDWPPTQNRLREIAA
jgi:hypothetical protein